MARGRDLIKNTGILMIAKISTQFVSFILLPLYTSLLSTSEYGEIDVYTSLTMIVIPFLTLQLEMGLFRFFITAKTESYKKQIITTSLCIIAGVLMASSVIYCMITVLLDLRYRGFIYVYYISMTVSTVFLQICRAYGDNIAYGIASFISSALAVCLNVLLIAGLHWKVEGILLSSTIAQTASSLYVIIKTRVLKYFDIDSFDRNVAKKLLQYSVPLIFNQISSWTVNYSDRLIILSVWGTSANGIYSLANKFSNITNTFFNVFNVAWTENVVRCMEDKDGIEYINKMFITIYNIYFALVTGIINLLPFVFGVLVNNRYYDAYGHVPVLMLATFFSGISATIGSIYIAYSKTKEVSITTIATGICNIVIHLVLLNKCGLYAASISTLVAFTLLFIYRYIFVRKFFQLRINIKDIIPQIIIYVISWLAYCSGKNFMIAAGLILNLSYIGLLFVNNKSMILGLIQNK